MNSSLKRNLGFGFAAVLGVVVFGLFWASAPSPPPHFVVYGAAKRIFPDPHFMRSVAGASLSISNAGTEAVFLQMNSQRRLQLNFNFLSSRGNIASPPLRPLQSGEVFDFGDCDIGEGQLYFRIRATTQGSKAQQLYHALIPTFIAFWITWDSDHARNVFKAERKSLAWFRGPTYSFERTISIEVLSGKEIPILVQLRPPLEERTKGKTASNQ